MTTTIKYTNETSIEDRVLDLHTSPSLVIHSDGSITLWDKQSHEQNSYVRDSNEIKIPHGTNVHDTAQEIATHLNNDGDFDYLTDGTYDFVIYEDGAEVGIYDDPAEYVQFEDHDDWLNSDTNEIKRIVDDIMLGDGIITFEIEDMIDYVTDYVNDNWKISIDDLKLTTSENGIWTIVVNGTEKWVCPTTEFDDAVEILEETHFQKCEDMVVDAYCSLCNDIDTVAYSLNGIENINAADYSEQDKQDLKHIIS